MIATLHDPQERIDKRVVADSFSRAAPRYDSVAHLQRLVAEQLLTWLPKEPFSRPILDVGCGTGYVVDQVLRRHPEADCIGLDIAEGMLRYSRAHFADIAHANNEHVHNDPAVKDHAVNERVQWLCADAEHLPLADSSIAVATSNFALQWCGNLGRAFVEIHRVLAAQGRFLVTLPAEDTLWELKESWRAADPAHSHVNQFADESLVRQAARKAGFKIKRAAVLSRCVFYPDVAGLMDELKTLGAHNATLGRSKTLTPKGVYRRMLASYETRRTPQGKLPATWRLLMLEMEKPHD